MARPNLTSDDDVVIDKDGTAVPKRVIRKAISSVVINDKIITELSIGFKKSRQEKVNEIPKKHHELLRQIQAIDS